MRIFNRALTILLLTNALILVAGAMFGPIYAIFVEGIGGDLLDASLTGGIFALAAGITTLLAGKYADKTKHDERIVIFGYAIMGAGFIMLIFVNNIWTLFAVQALIGFAEAMYSPAFDAIYSKHISLKKAGQEWGAWESMNYFTYAGGAALGGGIAYLFGFNILFSVMGALSFASAAYIVLNAKKLR